MLNKLFSSVSGIFSSAPAEGVSADKALIEKYKKLSLEEAKAAAKVVQAEKAAAKAALEEAKAFAKAEAEKAREERETLECLERTAERYARVQKVAEKRVKKATQERAAAEELANLQRQAIEAAKAARSLDVAARRSAVRAKLGE